MEQTHAHDAAALVVKLRARSSSADEQAECCGALGDLRLEGNAAAADAISAVVAALRDGVDHDTLQRNCCNALSQLMQQSADNRVCAAAAGALEATVAGLRAHPADAGVQAQGCAALMWLALNNAQVSAAAGAAGAVEVIITALLRHPDDMHVQYYGGDAKSHSHRTFTHACAVLRLECAWEHHAD
jgi:hypothetical protein